MADIRKTVAILFLFLCAAVFTITAVTCPRGWVVSSASSTCVKLYELKRTWPDARAVCQTAGGDLVKITDGVMNAFLSDVVAKPACNVHGCWTGLHANLNGETFMWLDETKETSYTYWGKRQPNKVSKEDCVAVFDAKKRWHDYPCGHEMVYICESASLSFDSVICPDGWMVSSASRTCVKLYWDKKTWSLARARCQNDGGDLVKIQDRKMNSFLTDVVARPVCYASGCWIGLHLSHDETFAWLDETREATYTRWGSNQPNNKPKEFCVATFGTTERWHDYSCRSEKAFICEIVTAPNLSEVTAEPSTNPTLVQSPTAPATTKNRVTTRTNKTITTAIDKMITKTTDKVAATTTEKMAALKADKMITKTTDKTASTATDETAAVTTDKTAVITAYKTTAISITADKTAATTTNRMVTTTTERIAAITTDKTAATTNQKVATNKDKRIVSATQQTTVGWERPVVKTTESVRSSTPKGKGYFDNKNSTFRKSPPYTIRPEDSAGLGAGAKAAIIGVTLTALVTVGAAMIGWFFYRRRSHHHTSTWQDNIKLTNQS